MKGSKFVSNVTLVLEKWRKMPFACDQVHWVKGFFRFTIIFSDPDADLVFIAPTEKIKIKLEAKNIFLILLPLANM